MRPALNGSSVPPTVPSAHAACPLRWPEGAGGHQGARAGLLLRPRAPPRDGRKRDHTHAGGQSLTSPCWIIAVVGSPAAGRWQS
jgi:hypothetical protein